MSTPGRIDVDMWQPHTMLPAAAAARQMAASLEAKAGLVRNAVVADLDRTSDWAGESRNSADDRAEAEKKWMTNLADNLEDVATSIEKGCENIANHKTFLISIQNAAFDAGYDLVSASDPQWNLKRKEGQEEKEGDAAAMESWRTRLVAQANAAFDAVRSAADSLGSELGNLSTITPSSLALNGTMGARDAGLASDGFSPDELRTIGEHLKEAQLTPEQLRALMNGENVAVPPGVVSYLRNLYGGLNPQQALELRYGLDKTDASAGTAFGNGINTLGNERVGGGGTAGGFNELPSWMRNIATERVPTNPKDVASLDPFARSFVLGQLVNGATTPPGTRLGSELIQKTANLAEAERNNPSGGSPYMSNLALLGPWGVENGLNDLVDTGHPDSSVFSGRYEDTLENLLGAGSLSHEASTAILSGHGGAEAGLEPDYNRDETLKSLFAHDWRDNGKSVGTLTDWIDDYAADQGNSHRAGLSAEAFRGMYDFTDNPANFTFLMDTNGGHSGSLGDINPELARAMEQATRPYFNILSGGNPLNYGFDQAAAEHLRNFGGPENDIGNDRDFQDGVRRLFGVISSDDGARAQLIRDIGLQQSYNAAHVSDALAGGQGFSADLAARNGWLQSLARDGVMADMLDDWHDDHPGNDVDADTFGSVKSNAKDVVTSLISAVPFVGDPAALGTGMAIDWINPPESVEADSGSQPSRAPMNDTLLEQHWAAWAATDPQPSGDPNDSLLFEPDGTIKPLAKVLEESNFDNTESRSSSPVALSEIMKNKLADKGIDVTNFDIVYNKFAGDDSNSIDYDYYELNLQGEK
ncbi:hypothetical protein ACPXCG_17980 [Gordonia sp. DT218]|uniref:TPR repeat region-containing protein n=1 Tax=unclassified Gordonia (in: high G+C Gram-positive bacteria) TaxID=2657482 RepID=UPI003CEC19AD